LEIEVGLLESLSGLARRVQELVQSDAVIQQHRFGLDYGLVDLFDFTIRKKDCVSSFVVDKTLRRLRQ